LPQAKSLDQPAFPVTMQQRQSKHWLWKWYNTTLHLMHCWTLLMLVGSTLLIHSAKQWVSRFLTAFQHN